MSRKKILTRKTLPDSKFNNTLVAKGINYIMEAGNKSLAEAIMYKSLDIVAKQIKKSQISIFESLIDNLKPTYEVKSRRIGGSNYSVPVQIRAERQTSLALKWLISFSRRRKEKSMIDRLSLEMIDAYNRKGGAFKKREETHKIAEANQAFSHYRW